MKARAHVSAFVVLAGLLAFVLAGCGWWDDGAGQLYRLPAIVEQSR